MSTGKKSLAPGPGRYRLKHEVSSEEVRIPRASLGGMFGSDTDPRDATKNADTKSVSRVAPTVPVPSGANESAAERARSARANAIVAEIATASPGTERMYLESLRALGAAGLDAVFRGFPGAVWFDRHSPVGREPKGRFASPLASLLFELGPAAYETIARLVDWPDPDTRYYAVLLAVDVDADALEQAMALRLLDDDPDIARLALSFAARAPRRAADALAWLTATLAIDGTDTSEGESASLLATLLAASSG